MAKHSRPSAVFRNKSLMGFTLIELLVVIAIIGILASVVLASLNSARTKARDSSRAAQLREVQKALELYYSDNGSYPAHNANTTLSGLSTSLAPAYLSSIPLDPSYGDTTSGYRYIRSADFQAYTLLVNLEGDAPIGWCSLNGNGGHPSWNGDPADGSGTNYVLCDF